MATQPRVSNKLRFDDFELDIRAGELRRHGVRVRLRGQPLLVLEILLERAGDLVTREELQGRIWPADTFVDFDHSLHNAIARIREVLGDSAEKPRYIETLPRRGYRYIGPVEEREAPRAESGTDAGLGIGPATIAKPSGGRMAVPGVLLLCGLLALGAVGWTMWRSIHAKAAAAAIHSIAVLPLTNLSGDPSEEYFADGMTEQLITDLAKVGSLRVVSRTSVMQYKGTNQSLAQIARALKVDAIVEGSVIRSGQRVRVTAQLIQAPADRHLWAETYDRDRGDILKLQEEVADAIAQQVRVQLTPEQHARIHSAHAVNPAAYDAYIKGRLYFTTEFTQPASLIKAQHLFEESIREDPNFAPAYAGLADTYVYLAYAGALPRDQAYPPARRFVDKALQLDDTVGEAYDTLGALSWNFEWDWDAADRAFSRAIALSPSYSCAHEDRAAFLAFRGRRAEALAEIATIDQLDSSFSSALTESATYYALRDYPHLIAAAQRGLLLNSGDSSQHYYLGAGYEGTGHLEEATAEYRKAVQTSNGSARPVVALAHALAATGRKAAAEKMLRDLERNATATASPYTMATIYAALGKNDQALAALEKACSRKSLEVGWIRSDLLLDSLRSDARFRDLLRRNGLT